MVTNILSTKSKILTEKDIQNEEFSTIMKMIHDANDEISTKIKGWLKNDLKWNNIILLSFYHLFFIYLCFTFKFFENSKTFAWAFFLGKLSVLGIGGGAHRLWTHRAYKAKRLLKIILSIFYATAGLNKLYDWVRDHRVHHKYTDTDADPHNSNRGFFFSHVGWLMMKKNPEVILKGREIDMSDIENDPVAMFSTKYHWILIFIFAVLIPTIVPVYGWNETWYRAFTSQFIRYIFTLHITWSVNSAAHLWGSRPFDAHMNPTDNLWVSFVSSGEGWHNYHHVFPWDYKASESLFFYSDFTTIFIQIFEKVGWAYDLKQPSKELVKVTAIKKGDGSYSLWTAAPYPVNKIE